MGYICQAIFYKNFNLQILGVVCCWPRKKLHNHPLGLWLINKYSNLEFPWDQHSKYGILDHKGHKTASCPRLQVFRISHIFCNLCTPNRSSWRIAADQGGVRCTLDVMIGCTWCSGARVLAHQSCFGSCYPFNGVEQIDLKQKIF